MTARRTVVLFDVNNTLLDNDAVVADLRAYLTREFGADRCAYMRLFEELRAELGYADYLGALQRYRQRHLHETRLLLMSSFLIDYPFPDRLYPGALDAVAAAGAHALPVILSDGDVVFQPRKIQRSGLSRAFDGRVLVYVHKEQELAFVEQHFPADHYVLVNDKLRVLAAVKGAWGDRVTTVFPRQGHYAFDPEVLARYPPADVTIERIADFQVLDFASLAA